MRFLFAIILSMLFISSFSGCTNSGPKASSSSGGTSAASTALLPVGSSSGAFSLNAVVLSNQDPNSLIELVGTNGEFGMFCPSADKCKCRLKWTDASGNFSEVDQALAYVESDMARCLYTAVGTTTTYFDVQLVVTDGGSSSNTVRVTVSAQNQSFNTALSSNYVPIQRYMCKDMIRISQNTSYYKGDSDLNSLLDPRLWSMGYAFNFYTESLGLDYGATARTTQPTGWECPPIPNDSTYDSAIDMHLYSLDYINLNAPLLTGLASGDNTIFPQDDNLGLTAGVCVAGTESGCEKFKINRHDYYLSSFESSLYQVPVCLYHRVENVAGTEPPPLKCTVDLTKGSATLGSAALAESGTDIVGFAAIPDANQNCPSSDAVQIPSGKKWAKLWRFRASLPIRSVQDVSNSGDVGNLYCTTRKKECMSGSPISGAGTVDIDGDSEEAEDNTAGVSVCHVTSSDSGLSGATGPSFGGQIAISGYGNCSSTGGVGDSHLPATGVYGAINTSTTVDDPTCTDNGVNCCLDYNKSSLGNSRRPANYTSGGDYCTPSLVGSFDASLTGGLAQDVWLMGNGAKRACIEADTDVNGKLLLTGFPDPLSTFGPLVTKSLETNSRYDYVYVVTPTRVTVENMQNPSDLIGRQYTPKRFINGTPVVYGLELGSDNSSDPLLRVSKFPLCVLQDTQ